MAGSKRRLPQLGDRQLGSVSYNLAAKYGKKDGHLQARFLLFVDSKKGPALKTDPFSALNTSLYYG
jgi:hypothetical protein